MDPELGTDILIPRRRRRIPRPAAGAVALAAGLAALGCGGPSRPAGAELARADAHRSVIRVPEAGGIVQVYRADSLEEAIWSSRSPVGPIRQLLGVNVEARLVLAIDGRGQLVAVDLESRGVRQLAAGIRAGVFVPDGSVYAVDTAGRLTRYDVSTPTAYRQPIPVARFRAGTLGDRFVTVTDSSPPELAIYSVERQLYATPVPDGEAAATYWGDLVAIADRQDVALFTTSEPFRSYLVPIEGAPRRVAFSPSGHRLYVATSERRLVVIDRFTREPVASIGLPAPVNAIRPDPSGRWLLARAERGDTVWVIDLPTHRLAATVTTSWADDLPTVAGGSLLIVRVDDDVAAYALDRPGLPETGRLEDAAQDRYVVSTWLPREHAVLAAAPADSQGDPAGAEGAADTTARPDEALFLQVSSSQNADWSRELARQLDQAGYPARVLEPASVDDGYRVVVGPYPTRDAAEEVGRRLGRPYFVLVNPGGGGSRR